MQSIRIKKIKRIKGEFTAPADKSVSQRAVMIGSIARGISYIDNFLDCDDSQRAIAAFKALGIKIRLRKPKKGLSTLYIQGKGLSGLKPSKKSIYIGNSGTTMRLICGILAAQNFKTVLKGDRSLTKRPMGRITSPLRKMGAVIIARKKGKEEYPPLKIHPGKLRPINHSMKLKSAQVKSCILLAGLFAKGATRVKEKIKTRDHTERMLKFFAADIAVKGLNIKLKGGKELLSPGRVFIPGDISSAAFFIVAACLASSSKLIIRRVGINPTRSFLLKILKRMGADIKVLKAASAGKRYEPYADLLIKSSSLKAVQITEEEAAYCIDELPVLCVAACFAKGKTKIRGIGELRVKETDRINSMVWNLKRMGADIYSRGEDLIIRGTGKLYPATLKSFGDHRTV